MLSSTAVHDIYMYKYVFKAVHMYLSMTTNYFVWILLI